MKINRVMRLTAYAWAMTCMISYPTLAQETGKRIAVMLAPTQDAFVGTWSNTFQKQVASYRARASIFSSPFDPSLQARQIDDAIAQKFDVIVVQTLSQNAIVPALTRAKNAGIPVLSVISELPNDGSGLTRSYVGEDSRRLGELAGEAMANALIAAGKPNGKVAAITGSLADNIAPFRLEGFKSALKRVAPQAELVAVEDVKWNPVTGEQAAGQLLARFAGSGGLDGIYGMNDRLANAAIQAGLAAGYKTGKTADDVIVVGGNCQAIGVQNLSSGRMAATVEMLPKVSATQAAAVVEMLLAGTAVEPTYYERHRIITSENLSEVRDVCSY